MNIFKNNYPKIHLGLLILRIGIGILFIFHGLPKITGGPEKWMLVGQAMGSLGITSGATFWGFMAAVTELVGGILLILGIFFRPVCVLLFLIMVVATTMQISKGEPFPVYSHPLKMVVLFFSLYFTGPGRYSLDYNFGKYKEQERP